MYSIILTNGNIVHIKADSVEWYRPDRMMIFINDGRTVARINADNVVGWIESDYEIKIEERK